MSPIVQSKEAEREAVLTVARIMMVAARTAPKSAGIDDILTLIVYGKKKDEIADKMETIGERRKAEAFRRDAKNVRDSEAVVLIGVRGSKSFLGLNCGACGFKNCKQFESRKKTSGEDFLGPTCLFKALDLGIALGSAAKIAGELNVDNRMMYRIGAAAAGSKLLPDATVVMGIPISARGKSIYFDRPTKT